MKGYKMLSNLKKLNVLFVSLDDTNKTIKDLEAEASRLRIFINSNIEFMEYRMSVHSIKVDRVNKMLNEEIKSLRSELKDLNEKIKISRFRSYDIKDEIVNISSLLIK